MMKTIDEKKAELDALRPLPVHTEASLRESLELEWIYNANASAGNTLALRETKVVLEGITIGGKTIREHVEILDHHEAIRYVEKIAARLEPLSEKQIQTMNRLVLDGTSASAGRYRYEGVAKEVEQLIAWYEATSDTHPVKRAAELYTRFLAVRPFMAGNRRTAGLLLNLELMKAGYPPAVIRNESIEDAVQRSLTLYLRLLSPSPGGSYTAEIKKCSITKI
jgi:Fic family protein